MSQTESDKPLTTPHHLAACLLYTAFLGPIVYWWFDGWESTPLVLIALAIIVGSWLSLGWRLMAIGIGALEKAAGIEGITGRAAGAGARKATSAVSAVLVFMERHPKGCWLAAGFGAAWLFAHVQVSFLDYWEWDWYRSPGLIKPPHHLDPWTPAQLMEHLRLFYVGGYTPESWWYFAGALWFFLVCNCLFALAIVAGMVRYNKGKAKRQWMAEILEAARKEAAAATE